MTIDQAIQLLMDGDPIVISDKTFHATNLEQIRLKTGEMIYLAKDDHDVWVGLDANSDEVTLYQELEEGIDASEDVLVYSGDDFELSLESDGSVIEGDETIDDISIRDFESGSGQRMRVIEYNVSGETIGMIGRIVAEEELQGV